MLKVSKTDVYGFEAAIRGMRNPYESWKYSDSDWGCNNALCCECFKTDCEDREKEYFVGPQDGTLMRNLVKDGTDHSKFMRFIDVTCDILAPLYWWKEMDTYKVGTVSNSTSTMHKIHSTPFTLGDFSYDELHQTGIKVLNDVIERLNIDRKRYNDTKEKEYWWQMIQTLPSSYNQLRTVKMNYAVLRNIYHARKDHKLNEWHMFCDWIKTLPYSELITEVFHETV